MPGVLTPLKGTCDYIRSFSGGTLDDLFLSYVLYTMEFHFLQLSRSLIEIASDLIICRLNRGSFFWIQTVNCTSFFRNRAFIESELVILFDKVFL